MEPRIYAVAASKQQIPYRTVNLPVAWSHFPEPILKSPGSAQGISRRWGDASVHTQQLAIQELCRQASTQGFATGDIAYVLALARTESGFNPDAAASTSSAAGIGQFIDSTGKAYGLTASNRFDLKANVAALIVHVKDNFRRAREKVSETASAHFYALAYALHHDGPRLNADGMEIAEHKVLPWKARFEAWIKSPEGEQICSAPLSAPSS